MKEKGKLTQIYHLDVNFPIFHGQDLPDAEITSILTTLKTWNPYLFKDGSVGASFSVQIIVVFPGTAYQNNKVCPVNRETRLDREDYWIETLRTSYLYGLNERKRKIDPNLPLGC